MWSDVELNVRCFILCKCNLYCSSLPVFHFRPFLCCLKSSFFFSPLPSPSLHPAVCSVLLRACASARQTLLKSSFSLHPEICHISLIFFVTARLIFPGPLFDGHSTCLIRSRHFLLISLFSFICFQGLFATIILIKSLLLLAFTWCATMLVMFWLWFY